MSNSSSIGTAALGGSIRYESPIKNNLSWTGSVGYLSFFDKFQGGFPTGNKIIPISGGVKYYFLEAGKGLYASADAGINFISYASSYPEFSRAKDKRFGFSPSIGYRVNRWDITGRYNLIHDTNFLGLRVAYIFGTK